MAVNAANLVNFGTAGGSLAVGDWTYSAYPLTAPTYLPLNNDTSSYLTSSYPALGAIFAPTTVAYSAAATTMPFYAFNITYGNGVFMTTSFNYNSIATSPDGVTWATNGIPYTSLGKIAYGKGRFAILGTSISPVASAVTSSTDGGVTFQNSNSYKQTELNNSSVATTINWTDIVNTGNLFITMGNYTYAIAQGATAFYVQRAIFGTSSDGVNYTYNSTTLYTNFYNSSSGLFCGAYGGGNLVYASATFYDGSLGQSNSGMFYSTNSGATWALATTPPDAATAQITDIAYGAGLFVAVNAYTSGTTNTVTNVYYTSPTGNVWTARTLPASLFWSGITYANGYFIAVGSTAGATTTVYSSPDGTTWTARTVPTATGGRGRIAGGGGKFVFMDGNVGTTRIGSGVLINLNTASANFSLPYIRPIAGTQAFIKAT